MVYKPKVSEEKKRVVADFISLAEKYPIIGVINMENLPGSQLQQIKVKLKDKIVLGMTKKRLFKIIFNKIEEKKKGINKLLPYLGGIPALLFTNENPFSLFKSLKKSKSRAPAKAGQTAPFDIKIPAGPTSFAPGPVIGELGMLGIKTKVEAGKIAIIQDTVVCKEGTKISPALASMLTRLNILPMEIGLNLVAVLENGDVLTREVLDVDEVKLANNLESAARHALNLSVETAFITPQNRELLIQKAFRAAKEIALESGVLTDATRGELLAKAERQMRALKNAANIRDAC